MLDPDVLRAFPKVSLHDHLDGGLRPQTILELAAEIDYPLPADTADDLGRWFAEAADSGSLDRYLETFDHTIAVMQTAAEPAARGPGVRGGSGGGRGHLRRDPMGPRATSSGRIDGEPGGGGRTRRAGRGHGGLSSGRSGDRGPPTGHLDAVRGPADSGDRRPGPRLPPRRSRRVRHCRGGEGVSGQPLPGVVPAPAPQQRLLHDPCR